MRTALRSVFLLTALLAALLMTPTLTHADDRQDLLRLVNAERQAAGAPPLRSVPALDQVAQWHAGVMARRGGSLQLPPGSTEAVRARMKEAGYLAHEWIESLQTSNGGPAAVVRGWRRNDPETYRRLLDPKMRDLGMGVDRLDGTPLYVFFFAEPEGDFFTRETLGLRDLPRIRAAMLAAVNAERKKAGVPPLTANPHLDTAAQRHAEDMLARAYFAHESPEQRTVRERARDAGYDWRNIGENIAQGQTSLAEVMDTWMHSPGHRRNILDRDFKELGVGLALGRSGAGPGHQVEWVQTFGTRR